MFPSSYIEVKVPIREVVTVAELPSRLSNSKDTIATSSSSQQNRMARALYDFNAETPEDLTLKVRSNIVTLSKSLLQFYSFSL